MRCSCCDRLLNDFEATRKSKSTGEYLDTCNKCMSLIVEDVRVTERGDFDPNEIPDEELIRVHEYSYEDPDEE